MPFRNGFDDVYEQSTLKLLQGIFESVWPALGEASTRTSREEVARCILAAYRAGNLATPSRRSPHNAVHGSRPI